MADDFIDTDTMLHLRENKRAIAAHFLCVALHYLQIRTYGFREIGFIDDKQIRLSDSGPGYFSNHAWSATREIRPALKICEGRPGEAMNSAAQVETDRVLQ